MQNEKITEPYCEYDIELKRKFREIQEQNKILLQELDKIEKQIDIDPKKALHKIKQIWRTQLKLRCDAHKLIPFNREKFNAYAKNMTNVMIDIISNNQFLTQCVINFDNLGIATKELFGKVLFHKMAAAYNDGKITQTNFAIKRYKRKTQAEYDWQHTITFKQNKKKYVTDIMYFLPTFMHEFSHYIYVKQSEKSPFGAQVAHIASSSAIFPSELPDNDKRQMNQPFEKPSYELMYYFFTKDTPVKLYRAIKNKQK